MTSARVRAHGPAAAYLLIAAVAAVLRFGWIEQVPNTLWVDEAWFGLKGREVLAGTDRLPLTPPALGAGDSAYQIYATALAQAAGAPAAYSARIASAGAGLLLVLLLYPALLVLFRPVLPEAHRRPAALAGMAVMAMHFSGLLYSRGGGQMAGAALATLLAATGMYLTFERRSWKWALATGIAIGLAQVTYEAALGLPILFAAYTAVRLLFAPGTPTHRAETLRLAAVTTAGALAAFAPFAVYYTTHPGIFLAHVAQTQAVAGDGGPAAMALNALRGLWNVWFGISFRGDGLPGRNLAGRPFFDPFSSLLLWIGIGWAAVCARRATSIQLLLAWIGVMSVPSALSSESPGFSRMLPMAPALAGFAALGAAVVWDRLASQGRAMRRMAAIALGMGIVLGGASSVHAYFVRWANQPRLFDALHAGARRTADRAIELSRDGDVFLTPRSNEFVRYPLELLLDGTPVIAFDARPECLPYADRSPRPTVYAVIQVMDGASLPALAAAYPGGAAVDAVMHPDGYAYSVFFRVPPGAPAPAPARAVDVRFEGGLRLIGFDAPARARPGETITVRLHWQAAEPIGEALTGFVHVGRGRSSQPLIGQHDGPLCPGFPTPRWTAGYAYVETRAMTLSPDAPPGGYDLRVGAYGDGGARLRILAADVPAEDDRAVLAPIAVP